MLPIYKAISFEGIMLGGSTRPWKIVVNTDNGIEIFVVKLYKTKAINESFSVAKDVYCSILADKFGLNTPAPALIDFPNEFISTLTAEMKSELDGKDSRIKFGCKLIEGAYPYIDTLHKHQLEKYQIESIYAFDNLIKNVDRKIIEGKSNILMKGTTSYLIDHELTFPVDEKTITDLKNNIWIYWKERHIFYSYLHHANRSTKLEYFEDFLVYLEAIDFHILDSYSEQLIGLGHHTKDHYSIIIDYLCTVKQMSKQFVKLLIAQLE